VSATGAAYAALAEACFELHARASDAERPARLEAVVEACRALRRLARVFPFMRAHAELAQGELAALLGKETKARACFAAAAESARTCELVPVEEAARSRRVAASS
jgi:hypothetical protein